KRLRQTGFFGVRGAQRPSRCSMIVLACVSHFLEQRRTLFMITKLMLAVLLAALLAPAPAVWAADATNADNTGRNVRDRNGTTRTPGDQGSSDADLKITQQIRKALTDSDRLSTDAKNVKIVTLDRVVTLRGPVDSTAERDAVAKVAQATAGVHRVENQLEIAH